MERFDININEVGEGWASGSIAMEAATKEEAIAKVQALIDTYTDLEAAMASQKVVMGNHRIQPSHFELSREYNYFPFYFTPAVKEVRVWIHMPGTYAESGWYRGALFTAKVLEVHSPTRAEICLHKDPDETSFDISPWDVECRSVLDSKDVLPEGCVKTLEEAQQAFADRDREVDSN